MIIPAIIRRPLGMAATYVRRLRIWWKIARDVRGSDPASVRAIWGSILASPATSAAGVTVWRDPLLLADADVKVRGVGSFHLRARTDDLWHVLPDREPAVFEAISTLLGPGDCFVDAGANIGFYSVLAASKVGPSGRVIAVEMMPDTAAILRTHARISGAGQIEVVEKALSDRVGARVTAHVVEGKFGQVSIDGSAKGTAITVETTTLDSILAGAATIRPMKMDLEGVEELALRGAVDCLNRIGAVIYECRSEDDAVSRLLVTRGYSVTAHDRANKIAARA